MRHSLQFSIAIIIALAACSSSAAKFSSSDFVGVSCSSKDGGKTCFGYNENYADGTSDSCGRVPDGPEFALKLTYEISGDHWCETVVKSSHPNFMPVGEKFCSIYLGRTPTGLSYRFTDDPPTKVRYSYSATRADKWCQPLIDALQ